MSRPEDDVEGGDLKKDLEYFHSIPWTRTLLSNPDYVVLPTPSREPKQSTEDAMFAETLKTHNTVRAWLTLRKKFSSSDGPVTELRFLLSLGYAVNGWPHVMHGGVTAFIMDEAMGTLMQLNAHTGNLGARDVFTAYLKTDYRRPIPTPSVVMAKAWLKRSEGRKTWVEAVIENEKGDVMATGEGLWVQPRELMAKI
ncbi:hypothetical protein ACLMJK_002606 [Lecanora helva]